MFGLSALELRLAAYGLILAVVAGVLIYERHAGEAEIRAEDKAAAVAEHATDLATNQGVIDELRQKLASLPASPVADQPAPTMRLCVPTRYVSAGPAASPAQPSVSANGPVPSGVLPGTEAGTDIGPGVQDLTLAGVLLATYRQELWTWSVKQAQKP